MEIVPQALEEYAASQASTEDPLLQELAIETRDNPRLADMQTGHVEGALLRMLVQICGARRVLEIGTFTGYSALAMAQGLPEDGELITCDIDPVATEIAKRYWERSPHGRKIKLHMRPALDTLRELEGPFDLVFIDADKESYTAYYEAALSVVRRGGLIVADNTLWDGKVLNPESPSDHAIIAFNKHVRRDERVDAVLLTVRDGVTLARVR